MVQQGVGHLWDGQQRTALFLLAHDGLTTTELLSIIGLKHAKQGKISSNVIFNQISQAKEKLQAQAKNSTHNGKLSISAIKTLCSLDSDKSILITNIT